MSLLEVLLGLWQTPWVIPVGTSAIEMRHPLVLACAPLPLLLTWRWRPYITRFEALHVPYFSVITAAIGKRADQDGLLVVRGMFERLLGVLAWMLLLLALAQPEWVDPPQHRIVPARDLLLALDISQSMDTRDIPDAGNKPRDRLFAARLAIDDFIGRRAGDRIGLLVFANSAHVVAPFTLDHALLHDMLAQIRTGMAGPRTMIGDAVGLGITLFERSHARAKVMILLTDGADTGSRIAPDAAARIAAERGITIHTIAIGQRGNSSDKVDVRALQDMARTTGGRFALAGRLTELQAIYARLDAIVKDKHTQLTHRARHSLFQWPLGAALLLFLSGQLTTLLVTWWRERRVVRKKAVDA